MLSRLSLITLAVILLGVLFFLITWDIPAPTTSHEVVIPDERLPR